MASESEINIESSFNLIKHRFLPFSFSPQKIRLKKNPEKKRWTEKCVEVTPHFLIIIKVK